MASGIAGELIQLIENELPDGRHSLQESYTNLERVAVYCESNYVQAADKKKALEETKNYTTHSLASVAYQINNLATNFLKLLDLQNSQLAEMESSVNHLSQIVMIHKEKVARREIGVLTTNKSASRPLGVKGGIIFPEQTERPIKYTRKAVDYTTLDEIGHGVRLHSGNPRAVRSPSVTSTSSSNAPTTKPPTPPVNRNDTLGRARGNHYRSVAPPVAPPSVPGHYGSQYGSAGMPPAGRYEAGYAPSPVMGTIHSPPPVGMAMPMAHGVPSPGMIQSAPNFPYGGRHDSVGKCYLLFADMSLPPPPPDLDSERRLSEGLHEDDPYAATGPQLTDASWRPKQYLEKVVAIYDYEADKADELAFNENAVIYVIKKNDDGWWEGVMDGVTGLFPSNYVEPCM
ncbi:hypothetical protein LOTGIDRAFT_107808 [Lottia gigantea]|uniref:SH3 domain-containing protein n=1 Tax=Lottia gigantea TaxID=225164 RepID=V3ZSA9_LOTGI|nr:hypothetical protein LOTGIDRAFT_107808 [Lottia gigantea]ESO85410.1 hypothetical protein LOTGIDRAFT_107808 [Lottia gigantea]